MTIQSDAPASGPSGTESDGCRPREEAIDRLAIILFWKMEHLDPSGDCDWSKSPEENWLALDEHSRAYYRSCISMLAANLPLWQRVFSRSGTHLPLLYRPGGADADSKRA
jgi:hypothetical protein